MKLAQEPAHLGRRTVGVACPQVLEKPKPGRDRVGILAPSDRLHELAQHLHHAFHRDDDDRVARHCGEQQVELAVQRRALAEVTLLLSGSSSS